MKNIYEGIAVICGSIIQINVLFLWAKLAVGTPFIGSEYFFTALVISFALGIAVYKMMLKILK